MTGEESVLTIKDLGTSIAIVLTLKPESASAA